MHLQKNTPTFEKMLKIKSIKEERECHAYRLVLKLTFLLTSVHGPILEKQVLHFTNLQNSVSKKMFAIVTLIKNWPISKQFWFT